MGEAYDREREVSPDAAEALRPEILDFIGDRDRSASYLMTRRRDGREIMRPVSTFVEDWVVGTVTQDLHLKTQHVRHDPVAGYLWVGREQRAGSPPDGAFAPQVVWMQGRAELVEDQDTLADFFRRRTEKLGRPFAHPGDDHTPYLIRVTPEYVRAEGWAGQRAVIYRDFPASDGRS